MGFKDRAGKGLDTSMRSWLKILQGKKPGEVLDEHYKELKEYEDEEKKKNRKKWWG